MTYMQLGRYWIVVTSNNLGIFDERTQIFPAPQPANEYATKLNEMRAGDRADWKAIRLWEAIDEMVDDATYNASFVD